VPWLDGDEAGDENDNEDEDDDVVELSDLDGSSGDELDAPITSGSDPSSWSPIEVDQKP